MCVSTRCDSGQSEDCLVIEQQNQEKSKKPENRDAKQATFSLLVPLSRASLPKGENKHTSKRKNAPSTAAFPDKAMDPMLSVCPTHSPMHSYVARSHSRAEWSLTKTRHFVSQNCPKIAKIRATNGLIFKSKCSDLSGCGDQPPIGRGADAEDNRAVAREEPAALAHC